MRTMAGEVHRDEDRKHEYADAYSDEDLDSSMETRRPLGLVSPLLLLTSPVTGQPPWFEDRQCRDHE